MGSSIASAHVHMRGDRPDLVEWLTGAVAQETGFRCYRTEWRGLGAIIPQVGVATEPVGLTIQVESDPDFVPAERDELIEELNGLVNETALGRLKLATSRLAIMSVAHPDTEVTAASITMGASTNLDPRSPQVDRVLRALVALTDGVAIDLVNGGVLSTPDGAWVAF